MNYLTLQLLGTVHVVNDQGTVPRFRSQRTKALLGYLAAEQRAISRDFLAALFWPDAPLAKGKANLRRELHNLAQILPGCWQTSRATVEFVPNADALTPSQADVTVDLYQFQECEANEQWQEAAHLIGGRFLEGVTLANNLDFETWLLGEQARWQQRAETVLTQLVNQHSQQANYDQALLYARQLLHHTPWDEATHRQIMWLLARKGDRTAALKQFEQCQRHLRQELGVAVSAETNALYQRIKQNTAFDLTHLPAKMATFIGRKYELSLLLNLLGDPAVRLITITGLGGMGKTRLALEAVAYYQQTKDTVSYFIPLSNIDSLDGFVRSLATAIGFQFSDALQPAQQLLMGLQGQKMLFVLDSFEHLLGCSHFVSQIVAVAPEVILLITSRERLNVQAETVVAIQGLDYQSSADQQSSAGQLFVQGCQRIQPTFEPTLSDISDIQKICHLVEGMPLAIELASAWINLLTPETILQRMESSLAILKSQSRDMPDRHLSIRATFNHSWQMLSQTERNVLKKLSVFVDGFDLPAAEQVAQATIFTLSSLVNKSLVSRVGETRFKLHDLLRHYAAEKLSVHPDDKQQILNQHCGYYSVLLAQYEYDSKINFHSISTNLLEIQADFENVLAAWAYARKHILKSEIENMSYFLSMSYEFFGLGREGQLTFGDALQQLEKHAEQIKPITWVRVLTHYGWFYQATYNLEQARIALEKAVTYAANLGNEHHADMGLLHTFLGWVVHLQGESVSARQILKHGLDLCTVADYHLGQVISYHMLGEIEYSAGHYNLALTYHRQILTQYPRQGYYVLLTLGFLSISYAALKKYVKAANHIHQLIDVLRSFPHMLSGLLALTAIATLYGRKGQAEQAIAYLALVLKHPQIGGLARYKAETVFKEFLPLVAEEVSNDIMAKAAKGHLPDLLIKHDFRVDAKVIDQLEMLLQKALAD